MKNRPDMRRFRLAVHTGWKPRPVRRHQRIQGKVDSGGERTFYAGNNHIEVVKGTDCDLACATAFGCLRVDIVEVCKVGGIFQFAEQRKPVPPYRSPGLRGHARKPLRR